MFSWFKSDDQKEEEKKKKADEAKTTQETNAPEEKKDASKPESKKDTNQQDKQEVNQKVYTNLSVKDMKLQKGDYLLDVLVQIVRDVDDCSDGTEPFDVFIKVLALNQVVVSRVEKNITKVSNTIWNQHLTMEVKSVEPKDIEQGILTLKVFKQGTLLSNSKLIGQTKLDLMYIYYNTPEHYLKNQWMALINQKKTGTKIRTVLKTSMQLLGPNDQQCDLKLDVSDLKDPNVKLMLPPELNPTCYQWKIKIFRGRNMAINAEWFSKIDPYIKVTIGEHSCQTKTKDNTENPEYNETIYIPSNHPSMIQDIKFEIWDENTMKDQLLATHHLPINHLNMPGAELWDQYFWLNFYTATDINSKAGDLMIRDIIPGNYFAGQLLVKIDRNITTTPHKITAEPILFNKGDGKDAKSKLFKTLQENKKAKGDTISSYEEQPPVQVKKLKLYYFIANGGNMPNNKSGDYRVTITCGEKELGKCTPKAYGGNDICFDKIDTVSFKMDYIQLTDSSMSDEKIKENWLRQIPDIVITYYVGKQSISYKKVSAYDLYYRKGIFENTLVKKCDWSDTDEDVQMKYFNKYHELDYDHTNNQTGCFEARPGNLSFNLQLIDVDCADDEPYDFQSWMQNEYFSKEWVPYTLKLYLFQCVNLPPGDPNGLSDPYVNFWYESKLTKSERFDKTLNPQYYTQYEFNFHLRETKKGKSGLSKAVKPLFIECWDYDLVYDDILTTVQVDLYDHERQNLIHELKTTVTDRIRQLEAIEEPNHDEIQELYEKKAYYDKNYVEKCYTNPEAFQDHMKYRPYIYKMKDLIRGSDSDALIYLKAVLTPKDQVRNISFEADYVNYKIDFYSVGFRDLKPHGMIPIKQPYLYLRMKDLLAKKYKIMTNNIETVNSKGVGNNKSLYTIIHTNLKLPRDPYLFPTLGIDVRDSFLGLFSFASMNWGSFNINLQAHTCAKLVENAKLGEVNYLKRNTHLSIADAILNNKKITKRSSQDDIEDLIDLKVDIAPTCHFIPRQSEKIEVINDVYVKPKKKAKIIFTEADLQYPTLVEAIQGKFKLYPVFKKEGPVYVEMTEYPNTILEPLSYGKGVKQYRYVIKFDNKIKNYCDTPYGDPHALDYATIQGYDNNKVYNIGEFVYYATLTRDVSRSLEEERYLKNLKTGVLHALTENYEYEVRLYLLRAFNIAKKDSDSESDPYAVVYTEQFYYNGKSEYQEDEPNPKFYKTFRFRCKIPETNTLTIEIWDDDLFCDELIGSTQISLTERVLSKSYMRILTKPVEEKPLYDSLSPHEKGRVRYILEVFKCSEKKKDEQKEFDIKSRISVVNSAKNSKTHSINGSKIVSRNSMVHGTKSINLRGQRTIHSKKAHKTKMAKDENGKDIEVINFTDKDMLQKYPLININPIPPRKYSVRMIVWNAEDVPPMDLGGTTDAYVKCMLENMYYEKKTDYDEIATDTHWFCNNGCPNWNYRLLWDYEITDIDEEHTLTVRLYDKDILSHDELIGEAQIDFTELAKFSYEEDMRQSAKLITDVETGEQTISRIKWSNEKDNDKFALNMYNVNKVGEREYRGKVWVSFQMVPMSVAELNPVGLGRENPNRDPFLPEPAGRISLMSGALGGFFCVAGTLKDYLFNILMIVGGIAIVVYTIYTFITSFSGSFISDIILK